MTCRLLETAQRELDEAVAHYDLQSAGFGDEFAEEVAKAIREIVAFPQAWPLVSERARKCRTHRFPYCLIYLIRADEIVVVAVMHQHREPGYWQERVAPSE